MDVKKTCEWRIVDIPQGMPIYNTGWWVVTQNGYYYPVWREDGK